MWRAFWKSGRSQCSRTRVAFSGYMDERLNPEEAARVEEHLGTCRGCREELESLRATVALLHSLPEETPSRRFAVVPARPLPGRRALPALRFATAGVILLLVAALAVDQTNVLEREEDTGLSFGWDSERGEDNAYWSVSGVKNSVDAQPETPVRLVVPDHTDNVYVVVNSLTAGGTVYGAVASGPDDVAQLVLGEGEDEIGSNENVEKFTVVTASSKTEDRFATNDATPRSEFDYIMKGQAGSYLNILSSDNNVLYSFNLEDSRREMVVAQDNNWLRPLEYSLVGLVAVLAGATSILWLRQKRERAAEVSKSKE